MPTAGVDLGELAAFALGGKPLRRDSRPAVHCVIAIAAIRSFGLEETAGKTEGGDVFVNLGLRLRLRDGFIDCPPPKRRILLRDLDAWHRKVQELEPFERKTAERQVGRLANLTQVLPELLTHMSAGYRASNAGYTDGGPRRLLKMVPLARDSPMQLGLARLLPHAIDLLQRNEGVPLAPRARFAGLDHLHYACFFHVVPCGRIHNVDILVHTIKNPITINNSLTNSLGTMYLSFNCDSDCLPYIANPQPGDALWPHLPVRLLNFIARQ